MNLNFNGISKTLTPIDVDGVTMFDLNEIHKEWELGPTDVPSQWRSKEKDAFVRTANLQFQRGGRGVGGRALATQPAVYAYAMWVSTEFFMAVVQCFTHVVNGDIAQAVAVAESVTRDEVQQCMDMQRPGARLSRLVRMAAAKIEAQWCAAGSLYPRSICKSQ